MTGEAGELEVAGTDDGVAEQPPLQLVTTIVERDHVVSMELGCVLVMGHVVYVVYETSVVSPPQPGLK